MKPRISFITLGVDNLEKSLRFYRDGLGLETRGIIGTEFEYGAVVFIDLQANLKLGLYPRKSLAKDSGLSMGAPNALEFSIGHNVSSKSEVNQVMKQAMDAGAVIVKPAQDTFWGGYAGYFQDFDGHLWEIAWNRNGRCRSRHTRFQTGEHINLAVQFLYASSLAKSPDQHYPFIPNLASKREVCDVGRFDLVCLIRQQARKNQCAPRPDERGEMRRQLNKCGGKDVGQHNVGVGTLGQGIWQKQGEPVQNRIALGVLAADD